MSDEDKVQIAILTERLDQFITGTEDYRKTIGESFSDIKEGQAENKRWMIKITEQIYDLPCKARAEASKWGKIVLGFQWAALAILSAITFKHVGWK